MQWGIRPLQPLKATPVWRMASLSVTYASGTSTPARPGDCQKIPSPSDLDRHLGVFQDACSVFVSPCGGSGKCARWWALLRGGRWLYIAILLTFYITSSRLSSDMGMRAQGSCCKDSGEAVAGERH